MYDIRKWKFAALAMVFLGGVFFSTNLWADFGTVLSVRGKAFLKTQEQGKWIPLKRGKKIYEGNAIKTDPKSFVRLLTPSGSLEKIPGGNELTVRFAGKTKEATGREKDNISEFVSEFFSEKKRTRINAVRSHLSPLQQDWIAFNYFNRLVPEQLEAALELSAAFQKNDFENRSKFILWKLQDLLRENEGLKALSLHAVQSYHNPGKWMIAKDGASLSTDGNDLVNIVYKSPHESYVYVFETRIGKKGEIMTRRLFPSASDLLALEDKEHFVGRVAAEETLFAKEDGVIVRKDSRPFGEPLTELKKGQEIEVIEKKGRRYRVKVNEDQTGWVLKHKLAGEIDTGGKKSGDLLAKVRRYNNEDIQYIWGFSSPGPLSDQIMNGVVLGVENELRKRGIVLTGDMVEAAAPQICGAIMVADLTGI